MGREWKASMKYTCDVCGLVVKENYTKAYEIWDGWHEDSLPEEWVGIRGKNPKIMCPECWAADPSREPYEVWS